MHMFSEIRAGAIIWLIFTKEKKGQESAEIDNHSV